MSIGNDARPSTVFMLRVATMLILRGGRQYSSRIAITHAKALPSLAAAGTIDASSAAHPAPSLSVDDADNALVVWQDHRCG